MTLGNILEHLPRIVPTTTMQVTEEGHEFVVHEYDDGSTHAVTTYTLDKAPIDRVETVTGVVDSETYTFVKGTDYAVIDDDGDGQDDAIDFDIGGEQPDAGTEFEVTYVADPIIKRYVESHETETSSFDGNIQDVIDSHQIDNASGSNLDEIGKLFGELGERRGRNDDEYRAFLKSIVQSFKGRGTVPGLKFAIAAGVGTDTSNITIDEDFTQVGYEIKIDNVDTQFLSSVVNDMADLADPSGVELLSPPIIVLNGDLIYLDTTGTSVVSTSSGLGSGTLTLDGNSQLQ